jgi:hypothetical protein
MKRIIFILTLISIGTMAFAQLAPVPPFSTEKFSNIPEKKNFKSQNKLDVSGWYIPLDMMSKSNVGASIQQFVGFITHDSLHKSVLSDGTITYGRGATSVGHVLDPKDDLIGQTDNPVLKLSQFISFKMDSVRFTYIYSRRVDSLDDGLGGKLPVVDTLFVAYYVGNSIVKNPFQLTQRHARVNWAGGTVRMPIGYYKLDTILLPPGRNDSTRVSNTNGNFENSYQLKVLTLPAPSGMDVAAANGANSNNLVATTFTFKSGIQSVIGTDTAIMSYQMDPSTFPVGARRTNFFGYLQGQNQGTTKWNNPTFFNSSLITYPRYAYATSGVQGYLPGVGYNVEQYIDVDFHLTTTSNNVGINEIKNDVVALSNVYPNPARSTEKSVIAFNLKESATVNVSIMNLMGQEVKNLFTQSFTDGAHAEFLDLSGLKPGVYMVNMTVNGTTVSKKLSVTE